MYSESAVLNCAGMVKLAGLRNIQHILGAGLLPPHRFPWICPCQIRGKNRGGSAAEIRAASISAFLPGLACSPALPPLLPAEFGWCSGSSAWSCAGAILLTLCGGAGWFPCVGASSLGPMQACCVGPGCNLGLQVLHVNRDRPAKSVCDALTVNSGLSIIIIII